MNYLKFNYSSLEFSEHHHHDIKSIKKQETADDDDDDDDNNDNDNNNCDCDKKKLKIIKLDELSLHDKSNDCWIAIYDYVYDCTNFLKIHPGGDDVIAEYAGRDATLAFIGYGHTSSAIDVLKNYIIGQLPENERLFVLSEYH